METMRFGQLVVRFDERVLRPRPWTLAQTLWAADLSDDLPAGRILELCAGVGHMGLALASLVTRELVLVDADAAACDHAAFNAATADLAVPVEVRHGQVDAMIGPDERFALILADPPWVPSHDTARYPDDPVFAIDGGPDGLDVARTCVDVIGRHLHVGGAAVLQLGTEHQAARIEGYLDAHPSLGLRIEETRTMAGANGVLVQLVDGPRGGVSDDYG
jgi:methylase of polypeptide subunit release factors